VEDAAMRHAKVIAVFFALCVIFPASVRAADEKDASQTLDALGDNLKFQNGVYLMHLKMYDKALRTLREYLEIHLNGNHRREAYKLIGDIYFDRLEYEKAIQSYQALYEEFSGTESGVGAYFDIGLCYHKMGYEKKAAEIFNDIVENHPESMYAKDARLQLDVLKIIEE
jgi:tetratricopeptide (TPR) repeat protein